MTAAPGAAEVVWMRVTGPDGLHELHADERDAVLRALDWAGYPIAGQEMAAPIDHLYDLLEATLDTTGECIRVREAG